MACVIDLDYNDIEKKDTRNISEGVVNEDEFHIFLCLYCNWHALFLHELQIRLAHYSEGTLLLASTPQQDQDILWFISSAPFPHRPYLTESPTITSLDGIVWNLAEIPDRCKANLHSLLGRAQKSKKVVLLTNQGAHIVALLKPFDILQQLLTACHLTGPHHEAIQDEREACVTALLLACSEQYRSSDLALWVAQAFMLYGNEPSLSNQMLGNIPAAPLTPQTHGAFNSTAFQKMKPTAVLVNIVAGPPPRAVNNLGFSKPNATFVKVEYRITLFQNFVRCYHYRFGYQCRLSDYGFLRSADLLEAVNGVVEIEFTSDEDKKVSLSPTIARVPLESFHRQQENRI
uniref:HTH OST-type domain-containing protein n=1 Tax=Glossina pallidipes TaxID=7398 RepID=A0A1A9ZJD8_GLOPL